MSSLRFGTSGRGCGDSLLPFGGSRLRRYLVLPRFMRRHVRHAGRLMRGDFVAPRYAATMLSAAYIGGAVAYGAYLGGHMPEVVQTITAHSGFAVDEIQVSGNRETSEIDVLDRLELNGWTSLIGFNPDEARERIQSLPWVETATVRKTYPDSIEVKIVEREAFAIWQTAGQLNVIERSGRIIAPFDGGRQASLPLIVGAGAPEGAISFIDRVAAYPELAARVKGYVRIGERRWDIRLENGITVKLPEFGEEAAMADLLQQQRENGLLDKDIAVVDMRIADRMVVQLTPGAMERREAELKQRGKTNAGKRI